MNKSNWRLRNMKNIALFLMMGLSITANAGLFGFGAVNWKEEVLLHEIGLNATARKVICAAANNHKTRWIAA